ncbi:SGNH hydrolase [Tersicoccus solisilvae]|uniref:SGNH hydrolase n=1 Tax=Tersicoccus solisilvae TaxID=1882339 RepID=A0ABQ1NPZ4_9MICC|nr:SGNH/GDSL hydrolase family protein [Tersicoccus solisilvae]GGC80114.1 SGNH hydrolase [Tersicoccus solisilvae]
MAGRFVALGDSFTEGVGDWNAARPNGVKGWADRVARQLARQDPAWEYANLAIRSKRLRQIVAEQLGPALALRPTLVTLYAGGNDILDLRTDVVALMAQYEECVAALAASGARVVLFTGYDLKISPLLEPFRRRHDVYNDEVRRISAAHGTDLIDFWSLTAYRDPRLWDPDRMHMSTAGHRYMTARVLETLGVRYVPNLPDDDPERRGVRQALRAEREWVTDWVLPMFGRKLRGVTLGDDLEPRWPDPIRPAEGMKRLARARMARLAG